MVAQVPIHDSPIVVAKSAETDSVFDSASSVPFPLRVSQRAAVYAAKFPPAITSSSDDDSSDSEFSGLPFYFSRKFPAKLAPVPLAPPLVPTQKVVSPKPVDSSRNVSNDSLSAIHGRISLPVPIGSDLSSTAGQPSDSSSKASQAVTPSRTQTSTPLASNSNFRKRVLGVAASSAIPPPDKVPLSNATRQFLMTGEPIALPFPSIGHFD